MKRTTYLLFFSLFVLGPAVWAIPNQITYQGSLKDKGLPASSPPNYAMTFQLTDQSGNNPYSNAVGNQVAVTNGLFSVPLSFQLIAPYTWDTITPYLKVTVNGQALSPTEPVNANAYAFVSNTVVNGAISLSKLDQNVQDSLPPTGSVMAFAGPTAPNGWLFCNGGAVSRTQYAALFAAIGNVWGPGDGSSTFNVPDLRGRAPIGVGQGPGLTNRTLGQITGEETHTLSVAEMPAHSHGVIDSKNDPNGFWVHHQDVPNSAASYGTQGIGVVNQDGQQTGGVLYKSAISIQNAGGNGAHNNMQPSIVINYIIKT